MEMDWNTNSAAVSLFRVTNMTDVTSCENAQNSPWVPFFARPVDNVLARESAFL